MMKEENEYIETLLERFFEGQTSNAEERQLYLFFRQKEIPEELIRFKPVVRYFENGLADELKCSPKDARAQNIAVNVPFWRNYRVIWGGVAASLQAILCTTLFLFKNTGTDSFDPFEGSYIIRNGVRITDLNLIRPELEATMREVMQQEEAMEQMIAQLTEITNIENLIMQQIEEQHRQILDDIQDEDVRREVQQILNTNL
jgi:hypothetical protein